MTLSTNGVSVLAPAAWGLGREDATRLCLAEAACFVCLAALTLSQGFTACCGLFSAASSPRLLENSRGGSISLTGSKIRAQLAGLLGLSNFLRALSLISISYWGDAFSPSSTLVLFRAMIEALPSLLLLSAICIVALFWAQVHSAALLVSRPLLLPTVLFLNVATYSAAIVIAILAHLVHRESKLAVYYDVMIGVGFMAASICLAIFGIRVANQLTESSNKSQRMRELSPSMAGARFLDDAATSESQIRRRQSLVGRVLFLSVTVPALLVVRAVFAFAVAYVGVYANKSESLERDVVNAVIYFIAEWIPSLLILIAFWPRTASSSATEALSQPLLQSLPNPSVFCSFPQTHPQQNDDNGHTIFPLGHSGAMFLGSPNARQQRLL